MRNPAMVNRAAGYIAALSAGRSSLGADGEATTPASCAAMMAAIAWTVSDASAPFAHLRGQHADTAVSRQHRRDDGAFRQSGTCDDDLQRRRS